MKLGIALFLAVEVFVFAMLPYFYSTIATNKKIINIFNTFSAGLFLGISFLHIIPEANESLSHSFGHEHEHEHHLSEGHGHHHHSLPYGSLISITTFLLVLGLEVYMHDGHCGSEAPSSSRKGTMADVLTNNKMKMRRRLIL